MTALLREKQDNVGVGDALLRSVFVLTLALLSNLTDAIFQEYLAARNCHDDRMRFLGDLIDLLQVVIEEQPLPIQWKLLVAHQHRYQTILSKNPTEPS